MKIESIVVDNSYLLSKAQDVINDELKLKVENGEIEAPYGNKDDWLNVVSIVPFAYIYNIHAITMYALDLIILMKIHNLSKETSREALRYISAFIIATESIYLWNRETFQGNFNMMLYRYFGIKKPLNYDKLRLVLNLSSTQFIVENEIIEVEV